MDERVAFMEMLFTILLLKKILFITFLAKNQKVGGQIYLQEGIAYYQFPMFFKYINGSYGNVTSNQVSNETVGKLFYLFII